MFASSTAFPTISRGLFLLSLMTMSLAGCGGGSDSAETSTAATSSSTDTPAASDPAAGMGASPTMPGMAPGMTPPATPGMTPDPGASASPDMHAAAGPPPEEAQANSASPNPMGHFADPAAIAGASPETAGGADAEREAQMRNFANSGNPMPGAGAVASASPEGFSAPGAPAGASPGQFADPAASTTPQTPGSPEGFAGSPEGFAGNPAGIGGEGAGHGGAGQAPPADAPEYPAFKLVMGLHDGKLEGLDEFISARAKGTLSEVRSGKMAESEVAELKSTFATPELAAPPKPISGGRQINLNCGEKFVSIVVKKEGEAWRVAEMSIRPRRTR